MTTVLEPKRLPYLLQCFFHPKGQFAGRKDDESLALPARQALYHWYPKRERLARSGLRDADDVLSFDARRDCLILNGVGTVKPSLVSTSRIFGAMPRPLNVCSDICGGETEFICLMIPYF